MSEDGTDRIEALLERLGREVATLHAEMATKDDLAAFRAETKDELAAFRAETKDELAALRAETKDELAALRAETKDELAALRAETKDELAAFRAETKDELAALRAEMATKQDLTGVAKNVDVTAMGRQLRELLAMKDDVTVLTAIMQRLDNTMARQIGDLLTEVRAEHSRMDRLLARVRALEHAHPEAE